MEYEYLFTSLICGIAVVHVVMRGAEVIQKWFGQPDLHKNSQQSKSSRRSDWYMFFHRSDLTGPQKNSESTKPVATRTSSGKKRRPDRRTVARINRP